MAIAALHLPASGGQTLAPVATTSDTMKCPGGMTVLGVLGWAVIGAAIGYHAAPRRGVSRASGVVSGAPWGALAVLLYFFDWPYLAD